MSQVILALKFKYCRDASQIARVFFGKAYFQSCLFFFCRYFHDGLQTVEHFGTYIEDLVSKLSVIRQSQFEEKRDLEEVRNMLKTSPGFNKTVNIFIQQKIHIFTIFFKNAQQSYEKFTQEAFMSTTIQRVKGMRGRFITTTDFSNVEVFRLLLKYFLHVF